MNIEERNFALLHPEKFNRYSTPAYLYFLIALSSIFGTTVTANAVTLPWSTSYNCSETDQFQAGWPNCDGLGLWGLWTAGGKGEQITTAANNPSGGGGRGQRQWNGDGSNVVSGGAKIDFSPVTEIYVRWYMRYQLGYKWGSLSYDKILYYHDGRNIPEFYGGNYWNFYAAGTNHTIANAGFSTANGGPTGDGKFHCYEIHQKINPGTGDDIGEFWLDGVYKGKVTGFDYSRPFDGFGIGENQANPANGTTAYVDFDDVAIQTTGPIGCLGGTAPPSGGATTPPPAPQNLTIVQP